MIKIEEKIV